MAWSLRIWHSRGDSDPLNQLGLDAQILIRFCQLGLKFSLFGSGLSFILLPLYATGPGHAAGFNKLCLSNLEMDGSIRFWCTILAAYLLTAASSYFVLVEWQSFAKIRRRHFAKAASGTSGSVAAQTCRTLFVDEVPSRQFSEQEITRFFEKIYGGGSVYSCVCASEGSAVQTDLPSAYLNPIDPITGSRCAFVTLKSAEHAAVAQQVVLSHEPGHQI